MSAIASINREYVNVQGPDATVYLQGQLSQDIESMSIGESRPAFLLEPQGKVAAYMRTTRLGESDYLLDTDTGFGEVVLDRLTRFMLRTNVEIEPENRETFRVVDVDDADAFEGLKLSVPEAPAIDVVAAGLEPTIDLPTYEYWRVTHGIPIMGVDLDAKTIPQESGLVESAVSFTKGCYTGQELVARLDTRGHVNRHLRRLVWQGEPLEPGTAICQDDREVGALTSVAPNPTGDDIVGLGYVRREVPVGAAVTLGALTVAAVADRQP